MKSVCVDVPTATILEVVCGHVEATYGEVMTALVLTGSMARGEIVAWAHEGHGVRVDGDAELLLIVPDDTALPTFEAIRRCAAACESALRARGVIVPIDLAAVREQYLRTLPPHVFGFELRERGRVVAGQTSILELIPPFEASAIPSEDAWRLLSNRIVELVSAAATFPSLEEGLQGDLQRRLAKLELDMATSFLLFAGGYAPSYAERCSNLSSLEASAIPAPGSIDLAALATHCRAATDRKLRGAQRDVDAATWGSALEVASALWFWELAQLVGERGDGMEIEPMMRTLNRRQRWLDRLRGWVHAVRQLRGSRSLEGWWRMVRLAAFTSPRHAIYSSAMDLLPLVGRLGPDERADEGTHQALDTAWRRLPAVQHAGAEAPPSWRGVAEDLGWGYAQLVAGTRA